ncbi:MAG: hypothetical protein IPO27_10145 [Bacteroidetes bacterium]|nr:hypothetical protein [Bacteroidota bacterium]
MIAIKKEHFFVVWDQLNGVGQHKIFGAAGAYTNGVGIVLCMNNYEFPAFKEPNGVNAVNFPYTVPDVAVMDLPPQNNNPGQVKVSFMGGTCNAVPTATATLSVTDEFRFTKFGVCNFIPISSNLAYIKYEMPGFQFGWPRIARHRRNGSLSDLQEGFTVVYEKHQPNANIYDIAGLTVFFDYVIIPGVLTLLVTDNVYTDGSAVFNNDPSKKLPQINNIINRRPVVSYERKSGAVNAGAKQIMCIAFEHAVNYFQGIGWCASFYAHNSDGRPFTETIGQTPNWLFYRVPFVTSNRSYGISVAGEMSEKFIYSFFTFPQQEIRHKTVASFAHLKEGAGFANNEISINTEILYDDFNPMFINEIYSDMQWTDIQGKLLCNNSSEFADIKASLKPGISYMSYRNKEGVHQKVKLVKL